MRPEENGFTRNSHRGFRKRGTGYGSVCATGRPLVAKILPRNVGFSAAPQKMRYRTSNDGISLLAYRLRIYAIPSILTFAVYCENIFYFIIKRKCASKAICSSFILFFDEENSINIFTQRETKRIFNWKGHENTWCFSIQNSSNERCNYHDKIYKKEKKLFT